MASERYALSDRGDRWLELFRRFGAYDDLLKELKLAAPDYVIAAIDVEPGHCTSAGVIDTWGGLSDLAQGRIRFLPMTDPDLWNCNSHYTSGADCLAMNILHWVGTVILLQLVSHKVQDPGKTVSPVADPESVRSVQGLLRAADFSGQQVPLFGQGTTDRQGRLDYRFYRAKGLLDSAVEQGIQDPSLVDIWQSLDRLRANRPA